MDFLKKLFGAHRQQPIREQEPTRVQPSTMRLVIQTLSIPRHEIETNPSSIDCLMGAVDLAAEATVKEGKRHLIEITISGYGTDPRELFEIPEVCDWAKRAFELAPSLYYFLTVDCQYRFVGWLCGPISKAEVSSASFQKRFAEQRMSFIAKGVIHGEDVLLRHGADKRLIETIRNHLRKNTI